MQVTLETQARTSNRINSVPTLLSLDRGIFQASLLFCYPQMFWHHVIVILSQCWDSSPWPRPTATPDLTPVQLYTMYEVGTVLPRHVRRVLRSNLRTLVPRLRGGVLATDMRVEKDTGCTGTTSHFALNYNSLRQQCIAGRPTWR
jgi:hypothetical protein